MFIGHFGIGFGSKRFAPKVGLGTLFFGAQFVDLLWPTLLLLGWEHVRIDPGNTVVTPLDFVDYPISHSLLGVICWAIVIGLGYWLIKRRTRGAVVLGIAVVSHWLLDLATHRPDLPLIPGFATKVGLGLWSSLPATLVAEILLFAAGVYLYVRSTKSTDRIGTWSLISLVVFLLAVYTSNLFGSVPPSESAIAWVAQAQWLIVLWGFWIDRHRESIAAS